MKKIKEQKTEQVKMFSKDEAIKFTMPTKKPAEPFLKLQKSVDSQFIITFKSTGGISLQTIGEVLPLQLLGAIELIKGVNLDKLIKEWVVFDPKKVK